MQTNTSISLPLQEAKLEGASTAYTPAASFSLRDQVENITRTITNQQKIIEANEKEEREKRNYNGS